MLDFLFGRRGHEGSRSLVLSDVSVSNAGLVRPDNQDSLLIWRAANLYCVADGMGGASEGARASEMVCRELRMMMTAVGSNFDERVKAVRYGLVSANAAIWNYARECGYRQMGTTAVVLVFDPEDYGHAAVIHVGDSRVYRIRKGRAVALTRDHTVAVELGEIELPNDRTVDDRRSPHAHVLTRAVGAREKLVCETREIEVLPHDRYVLCSDGVHDVISAQRLGEIVAHGELDGVAGELSRAIVTEGAPDNYSFIVLDVKNGASL